MLLSNFDQPGSEAKHSVETYKHHTVEIMHVALQVCYVISSFFGKFGGTAQMSPPQAVRAKSQSSNFLFGFVDLHSASCLSGNPCKPMMRGCGYDCVRSQHCQTGI